MGLFTRVWCSYGTPVIWSSPAVQGFQIEMAEDIKWPFQGRVSSPPGAGLRGKG